MAALTPVPKIQFFDANGNPLAGGKLYSYDAGTTTPRSTYTNYGGATPNANPVILDSRGEANVWLDNSLYKLKLTSATDVEIWTVDNIGGPDQATLAQLAASGGSALVGFLQAGTGAVTRTAQSKMRDVVSVKDFGAVGDGVADDTAEIQAAVDAVFAAGGGTVYFPAGTYKITSSISMKLNVCLLGASGRASRIVQHTNSTSCLSFTRNNGIFNDITSLGFTINPGVTGVTLLNIGSDVGVGSVGNINITSCNFNGGATAINIDAGYYINIFGSYFANQTAYGVRLVGDGGANANNIIGNVFNTITGYAVFIARDSGLATFQVTVSNNDFEAITGDAIYCPQTGVYTFSSNYFEAITGSEIVVPGTANVSGIGNYSADGATILNFSSAARGVFAVSPITASGDVRVNVGGTVITSNGNTQLDITNSAGSNQIWNLQTTDITFATAGRGLNFNANANAPGMTSELLNWYEEGTWTPTYATTGTALGSVTYGIQSATYTRIGRVVHIKMRIRTNAVTVGSASGGLVIDGLPFTSASGRCPVTIGYVDGFSTNNPTDAEVTSGGTTIELYFRTAANGVSQTMLPSNLGTGSSQNDLAIGGFYFV